jgi:hypothetical protein
MVGQAHRLDYTAPEVALPLFGMYVLWSASTPLRESMITRVPYVRRLRPSSASAMTGQAPL